MTYIFSLPGEVLCDIFSLIIQNSRVFPDVFKTGNTFQDCVSLINLSRVCRRWREIALSDSSLWSSIFILLDNPAAKTLRQAAYFADTCLSRSNGLPLTCAISLSNLDSLRLARPLILTLISHEDRWSRIAINFTPSTRPFRSAEIAFPESEDSDGATGEHDLLLRYAGSSHLKEIHSDLAPWFTYSLHSPLPALSTLRLTCFTLIGCVYTLANWLPLTPNLQELELTINHNRFVAYGAEPNEQVWKVAERDVTHRPHFVLPALRTLNIWAPLIPFFTCPALERYVMEKILWHAQDLTNYLEFIERSGNPPSFRSIEIKESDSLLDIAYVHGYLLPTITNLRVISHSNIFFMLSEQSEEDGVVRFSVLPALEYLEITDWRDACLPYFSSLLTSRWDIGVPHRTLKTVKLKQHFEASPVPELLLSPPSDGIDLTQVREDWREIARCVNEGLLLS
ncbi:hypothetical protein SCHPADRAFT_598395 [Schizopora paradoxa]|uniref:F-box domain-containing protein n=1 Tax=Schizopora paradoxa TaxID=27342 RepID=A0A0H2RA17_9AGAM|nr:hypothetical protein SCHPADRAFT_598395 [Schizopora paradoxa]